MKKKLREAIENIDLVNNIDGQDFDKEFVGTAPVSYADAVLRARKHREDGARSCEKQTKRAKEVLKKEISNAEHPEPLDKIKVNGEGKMTLDEGLFESLSEDAQDVFTVKNNVRQVLNHLIEGMNILEEISKSNVSEEARKKFKDVMLDIAQAADRISYLGRNLKESLDEGHLGHGDDVCPKCGKDPCECKIDEGLSEDYNAKGYSGVPGREREVSDERLQNVLDIAKKVDPEAKCDFDDDLIYHDNAWWILLSGDWSVYDSDSYSRKYDQLLKDVEKAINDASNEYWSKFDKNESLGGDFQAKDESVIRYPNGMEVTDIDLDKALDYQYGTDRDKDNSKYTDDEKQKAVDYWIKKTDTSPYDVSKEEVEPLEESKEGVKVFRVTYKHSPEVFSSAMVRAASEDEAKRKLSTKKPGKDIVGVSVMSDYEVKDMTNRGMSLIEAKVVDDFSSYEPWGAAVSTFEAIQAAGKMDALEQLIDDMYPDGIDRTELNDLLAYESDWVYSMLNMSADEEAFDEDEPAVDFDEEE